MRRPIPATPPPPEKLLPVEAGRASALARSRPKRAFEPLLAAHLRTEWHAVIQIRISMKPRRRCSIT
jgi:hypothetical protein